MEETASLCDLKIGQAGRVISVTGEEAMRRRLMELGFTPGAAVTPILSAAFGDPTAYLIRGTVIALRAADARKITAIPQP